MARKKTENSQPEPDKSSEKPEKKAAKSAKNRTVRKQKPPSGEKKPSNTEKSPAKTKPPAKRKPAKKPAKKTPHATRPTKKEELEILERRRRVFDLKKNGASVRKIASLLQAEGHKHCSIGTVQSDLVAVLDEAQAELDLDSGQWLTLMIERNEEQFLRVRTAMYQEVEGTDSTGKKVIVKKEVFDPEKENLLQRNQLFLDKLIGASKHEQSKNTVANALAALIGCSPDELGEEDDNDDDD